ncbi:MAG: hypothetical protein R3298_09770 [Gammaproteobacteria bacterium]|nr:hypothetical protein [Gammaproteobacteria bacterium]
MATGEAGAAKRRYRTARAVMRGGVLVALVAVLALPPGPASLLLFFAACLAVAWGAWRRHRDCPARLAARSGGTETTRR